MSRIQKMKGLVAASLRVKALNDNPYNIFATGSRNGVVESSPYPTFKPLAQTIKQPFNTDRNGSIYFTSPETALQEIKTQLAVKSFDIHTQYVAIYISPVNKDNVNNPAHDVYFKIKENHLTGYLPRQP